MGYSKVARTIDTSRPTGTTLTLPAALAQGVILAGLTAPSMRVALVLIANASSAGRIDMLKPEVEKLAGVRMDNANRMIERLLQSVIDIPYSEEPEVGEPVFDELIYTPGIEKRFAGVIIGTLSGSFRTAVGRMTRTGTVMLDIDVLRRLSTVPGIVLYIRLQLERSKAPKEAVIRFRLKDADGFAMFGQYCRQASTGRVSADGESFRSISLGRIARHLIEPAVRDLGDASQDIEINAVAGIPEQAVRGKAWSHVDIVARRLKRVSLKEFVDRQDEKQRHRARVDAAKGKKTA